MDYLHFAVETARAAGEILKYYARRDKSVELKGRANLVTAADKESEALIIDAIRRRYPGHAILAEESGALSGSEQAPGQWVIDPIDGTTNFAHQYPFFCVSIGFEQQGKQVCGAVYDPFRDEMFSASAGSGAFLNGEPIRVSAASQLGDALLMTGFPYNFRDDIDAILAKFRAFLCASQAVRRGGSAALDMCYVAMGRCDGFWEQDLNPWDTAAAKVILEEAGGRLSDFRGEPFSIYRKEIVASNARLHDEMIQVLASTAS